MKKLLLLCLAVMMLASGCAKIDIGVGKDNDDDRSLRPAADAPVLALRDKD